MIHREDRESVATLRIEHGKVNAIDLEMFTELRQRLEEIKQSSIEAVVLTGTGKSFSVGVDLFRVLQDGRPYIEKFLPVLSGGLEDLFLFPKPVIALINGHAIAGGSILACACDFRIATDGPSRIGIPELLVGVPFPPSALEIVRFAAPQFVQEIVYTGRYYDLVEALDLALIDEIVLPEASATRAFELAKQFGAIPATSFKMTKHQLRYPAIQKARASITDSRQIVDAWSDPEIHEIIRNYLAKTINKS
jgi:enoyl-CoA hydratase/carnithine racemase